MRGRESRISCFFHESFELFALSLGIDDLADIRGTLLISIFGGVWNNFFIKAPMFSYDSCYVIKIVFRSFFNLIWNVYYDQTLCTCMSNKCTEKLMAHERESETAIIHNAIRKLSSGCVKIQLLSANEESFTNITSSSFKSRDVATTRRDSQRRTSPRLTLQIVNPQTTTNLSSTPEPRRKSRSNETAMSSSLDNMSWQALQVDNVVPLGSGHSM